MSDTCRCGRPMLIRPSELQPSCAQCRNKPEYCDCDVIDQVGTWEEPVPLGTLRVLPDFPVDAFPGWLAQMVRAVATETQTPADIPATVALAALSAAAGGQVVVQVREGWTEPVNLYLAAVAEPGTRKSAVYQALTRALTAAETALNDARAQKRYEAQITYDRLADLDQKARKAAVNAKAEDAPDAIEAAAEAARQLQDAPLPVLVQLLTGDISPEECTTVLAAQGGRLAIMSAEGRIFDIITGRYSNGVPALTPFLEGHAGDALRVNRRERREVVEHPALTIGVCIQPAVLTEVMSKPRLRGQGLLARILFTLPRDRVGRRISEPPATPAEVREAYDLNLKTMVLSLAEWQDDPQILVLEDNARKVIVEYLALIEPRLLPEGDLFQIRDWAAKLTGAAARIAGLLHVASHIKDGYAKPISEDTMKLAVRVADYYSEHALAAFGIISAGPYYKLAQDILSWIYPADDSAIRGEFSQRDVHRKFQREELPHLSRALRLLEVHGYIRGKPTQQPGPQGGRRPSPSYESHPKRP